MRPTPPRPLASTGALAFALVAATGCADLGQAAVVEAQKSFRVPLEGFEVDVPDPRFDALVGEEEIEALLLDAGATAAELDALGVPLHELSAVGGVVPVEAILPALGALVAERLGECIETAARETLDGETMHLEVGLGAWDGFAVDAADPDGSIARALAERPVTLRLLVEADSVDELLSGDGDGAGGDGQGTSELEELADLEILRSLFVREVGLRTLTDDEVEPEAGFTDEERREVEAALRDPARVGRCDGDRPELDDRAAARVTVQSIADPFLYTTLAEVKLEGGEPVCGVVLAGDDDTDLEPYLDGGLRLVLALETALGTEDFWLGGYVHAGVVARFRLPGSLTDLSAL